MAKVEEPLKQTPPVQAPPVQAPLPANVPKPDTNTSPAPEKREEQPKTNPMAVPPPADAGPKTLPLTRAEFRDKVKTFKNRAPGFSGGGTG
jgi:hypothetical protein